MDGYAPEGSPGMAADGFARFYDFYDPPEYRGDQLDTYAALALETGAPILELACGTGIVTLELARRGIEVTGLDVSPGMLAMAREKLAGEPPDVRERLDLVEGDMAAFDLGREYRAVLVPNNAFGYLTTPEAQRGCLAAVRRHLVDGGHLVIEERLLTPEVLVGMLSRRGVPTVQMARVHPDTGWFTTFHWITNHIDVVSQTIVSTRYVEEVLDDGAVRRIVPENGGKQRARYFTPAELRLLLEEAGFDVESSWGGYDRRPVTSSSRSQILIGRKR